MEPFSIHLSRVTDAGREAVKVIYRKEPKTPRAARNQRRILEDVMDSGGVNSVKMWAATRNNITIVEE